MASDALFETEQFVVKSSSKLPILLRHLNCYGFFPKYADAFLPLRHHLPNRIYVHYHYYWPKEEYQQQAREIEEKIEQNHKILENYFVATLRAMEELVKLTEEIGNKEYASFSSQELATELESIWERQRPIMGCWYFQLPLDTYLGEKISEELKRILPAALHHSVPSLMMDLTANTIEDTDLMKEKINVLQIVESIESLGIEDPHHPEISSRIDAHLQRFKYLKTSFETTGEYTFEEIVERIRQTKMLSGKERAALQQNNQVCHLKEKIVALMKEYHLQELAKLQQLLQDAQMHTYIRNRRVEIYMRLEYAIRTRLFAQITMRRDVPLADLLQMKPEEIVDLVIQGKKIHPSEMSRRMEDYVLEMRNYQQILITDPNPIAKIRQQYELELPRKTQEWHGFVACSGMALGKVRIIYGSHDISKVQEGDILVAKFTLPDFVPAMSKAAAILTDMGGISSHAAIVSRELNKPCVIGLKNASTTLQDRDVVEVDAMKGIVRIIQQS